MASIEDLSAALINADKAGDTTAAQAFAAEISRMQSAANIQPPPPATPGEAQGSVYNALFPGGDQSASMPSVGDALRSGLGMAPETNKASQQLDKLYSSGIYAGAYNPLGPIAKSMAAGGAGIQDALTFGFGDELFGGKDRQQALAKSNPIATTLGTVAGGLALPGGAVTQDAAGALQGTRGVLAAVTPNLAPAASLAHRAAVGAGEGFGLGALYGLGSGEDGDRAKSALIGGGLGAVGGAAIPTLAAGASTALQLGADHAAQAAVARGAGVDPSVAQLLTRTLSADGTLGPQGLANMQAAGGEAMIADAGPNARGLLDTSIQRGGPGAVTAINRVDQRVGRDTAAVATALDSSLGAPEGVNAAQANIRNAARAGVNDAYDGPNGAFAQPIDYASEPGRRLEGIINRIPPRIANRAIASANERLTYNQTPNQQIRANIADDGTVTYHEMPNVRQADAIRRALNEIRDDGTDPVTNKMNSDAQFASQMSGDLRDALRDAVPQYATALRTAADPLGRQSAVAFGARMLSPSVTRDQVATETARYTAPEQDALAQGVRSRIDDLMANVTRTVRDGGTDAREAYKAIRDLSSRANREKLTLAIGQQRAQPLFDELDRAGQSFALRGRLADNSLTFARGAAKEMVDQQTAPNALQVLGQGKIADAPKQALSYLTGQSPAAILARQDAIYSQLSDFLTRPTAQAIPNFQAMTNFGTQTAANAARAQTVAELLSQGRNAVYPASALAAGRNQPAPRR